MSDDVLVDLRHFQDVNVELRGGKNWVTAGGGCQIKRLLAELKRQDSGTLPSMGLITEQTIAGAISTATHGSGNQSMSHFVDEVRVATYDPATGEPMIRTINEGDELRAAALLAWHAGRDRLGRILVAAKVQRRRILSALRRHPECAGQGGRVSAAAVFLDALALAVFCSAPSRDDAAAWRLGHAVPHLFFSAIRHRAPPVGLADCAVYPQPVANPTFIPTPDAANGNPELESHRRLQSDARYGARALQAHRVRDTRAAVATGRSCRFCRANAEALWRRAGGA